MSAHHPVIAASAVNGITTRSTAVNKTIVSSIGIDLPTKINRIVNIVFDTGWRLRNTPAFGKKGAFCDFNIVVGL